MTAHAAFLPDRGNAIFPRPQFRDPLQIGLTPRPWWDEFGQSVNQIPIVQFIPSEAIPWTDKVNAWSTLVIGFIAIYGVIKAGRESRERQRAIDSKIGVQAYHLHRLMTNWARKTEDRNTEDFLSWWRSNRGTIVSQVEEHLDTMLTTAPDASPGVRRKVRMISDNFYGAVAELREAQVPEGLPAARKARDRLANCTTDLGFIIPRD